MSNGQNVSFKEPCPTTAPFGRGGGVPYDLAHRDLVNGNMDQNLRFSGGLILTHTRLPPKSTFQGVGPLLCIPSHVQWCVYGAVPRTYRVLVAGAVGAHVEARAVVGGPALVALVPPGSPAKML